MQPTTEAEWKAYLTAHAPLTVGVCGGRFYSDHRRVFAVLGQLNLSYGIGRLFHGAAPGADALASCWREQVAKTVRVVKAVCLDSIPTPDEQPYPAKWKQYGKAAGPIRNAAMLAAELERGPVHLLLAFPGGGGTADMVRRSREAGVPVFEVPA